MGRISKDRTCQKIVTPQISVQTTGVTSLQLSHGIKLAERESLANNHRCFGGTNNSRRERMKPCIFIDQVYPPRFSPRVFVFSALAHLSNPNRERRNTTESLSPKDDNTHTYFQSVYHSYQASSENLKKKRCYVHAEWILEKGGSIITSVRREFRKEEHFRRDRVPIVKLNRSIYRSMLIIPFEPGNQVAPRLLRKDSAGGGGGGLVARAGPWLEEKKITGPTSAVRP